MSLRYCTYNAFLESEVVLQYLKSTFFLGYIFGVLVTIHFSLLFKLLDQSTVTLTYLQF